MLARHIKLFCIKTQKDHTFVFSLNTMSIQIFGSSQTFVCLQTMGAV